MTTTPMLAFEPNKISFYNQYWRDDNPLLSSNDTRGSLSLYTKMMNSLNGSSSVTREFHNFKISNNAIKAIRRKINWLYFLAKSKNVISPNGKQIFNFRLSFITFTLPSTQIHPTSQITSELWNHMLTELRRSTGMQNYVWRLEFQNNGNVHYHLVTDTFISYQHALRKWNHICEKLGYVSAYSESMSKLSLSEYVKKFAKSSKNDFSILKERYAKGVKSNWREPNSIDVKSVKSKDAIGGYISKYFSKTKENQTICNPLDTIDNSRALRLWYSSQSLSKLKSAIFFEQELNFDYRGIMLKEKKARELVFDYASLIIYDFNDLSKFVKKHLNNILQKFAFECGFSPHIQSLFNYS